MKMGEAMEYYKRGWYDRVNGHEWRGKRVIKWEMREEKK